MEEKQEKKPWELIEENLKALGLSKKYAHPGIYCIKLQGRIVYVGKSTNMLKRVASHMYNIEVDTGHKYAILKEAQRRGLDVEFDVLYHVFQVDDNTPDLIGKKEAYYINKHKPALNTQYPHMDNYKKYTYCKKAQIITLDEILAETELTGCHTPSTAAS